MAVVGFAVGFVDFTTPLPISEVAKLLSSRVFGGIEFVEKDVDSEDDIGTLVLGQDFLGLQVDLFGCDGTFTIEIGTKPSASVAGIDEVCDLSAMLRQRIGELNELTLS